MPDTKPKKELFTVGLFLGKNQIATIELSATDEFDAAAQAAVMVKPKITKSYKKK